MGLSPHGDPVWGGVVACTGLLELNLARCAERMRLTRLKSPLQSLTLDGNALSCSQLGALVELPVLHGLSQLSLNGMKRRKASARGAWPWEHVYALTALRELRIAKSNFGDIAAGDNFGDNAAALAMRITDTEGGDTITDSDSRDENGGGSDGSDDNIDSSDESGNSARDPSFECCNMLRRA